jgi:release factor glutamine methyltransferase
LDTIDLGAWIVQARARLKDRSDQPGLEASLLAAFQLGQTLSWIYAHPQQHLAADQTQELNSLLEQLAVGTPLPYLTHTQEFYGLKFTVSPAVLIPRPETELLVEQALTWLAQRIRGPAPCCAADVGTGSGCIAVTLAKRTPDLRVLACDLSLAALRLAAQNAAMHAVSSRIQWMQSDLLSAAAGPFDLVCANLPYIPTQTLANLEVARHEPTLALDGGADGLDAIRCLLADAPRWLTPGGLLLLEIETRQGPAAAALAQQAFPGAHAHVLQDLAGHDRLIRIERT